ncbi:MAG: hypothetical protein JNL63_03730 [Bacteroidia bacterium]|nr:hypothetical protein [Bacteroidia bacterium]
MDNLWLVLGYEKDFKNKICANLSVGYSFSQPSQKGGLLTVPYTVKNGFNISAEIKKRITDRLYIGGHLFFQNTMATGTETVLDYITETPVLLSHYKDISYSVDRSDMAFHVKFGKRCVFKGGITIDNSIGLGIRYISSQSIGKQSGDINYHSNYFETPYSKQYDDGAAFFPSFVYHLKIGFSF